MRKKISKLKQWMKHFLVGDFKQLLIFLIALFIFRPGETGINYIVIWHFFFTAVLLAAIFNCNHRKSVKEAAMVIGIPVIIANWSSLFYPAEWLFIVALCGSLLFLVFAIFSLLHRVLLSRVTSDVLRGTVCVYFMIGFAFSITYVILELLYPGSFHGLDVAKSFFAHGHYHAEMAYFSFITLLAVGYGDITPLSSTTQMLAVSEALIGEFYLAILVARIVTIYAYRAKEQAK